MKDNDVYIMMLICAAMVIGGAMLMFDDIIVTNIKYQSVKECTK